MTETCVTLKYPSARRKSSFLSLSFCILSCTIVFFQEYFIGSADVLLFSETLILALIMSLIRGTMSLSNLWLVWCLYFFLVVIELPFSHDIISSVKVFVVTLALWASVYLYAGYQRCRDLLPEMLFLTSGFYTVSVMVQFLFPEIVDAFNARFLTAESYEHFRKGYEAGSFSGIAKETGVVAYYCVIFSAFHVCALLFEQKNRFRHYLFISVSILALMLTKKRAHFLGLLIVIVVIIAYKEGMRTFKKILAAGIGMAVLLLIASQIPEMQVIIERITKGGLSGREQIYAILLKQFRQNPLTGIGLGCSGMYIYGHSNASTAHNEYLRTLCETGIFGFIAFGTALCYVYFHTLRRFRRALRRKSVPDRELTLMAFSIFMQTFILMYSMTGNPLSDYSQLYMYFLCVMLGNPRYAESHTAPLDFRKSDKF